MSEANFISHIVSTVCDYAKENGYPINDTIKTMGESLIALTGIVTFDNWEHSGEVRNGKTVRPKEQIEIEEGWW